MNKKREYTKRLVIFDLGGGYPRKARIQQDQTAPPRRQKIIKGA